MCSVFYFHSSDLFFLMDRSPKLLKNFSVPRGCDGRTEASQRRTLPQCSSDSSSGQLSLQLAMLSLVGPAYYTIIPANGRRSAAPLTCSRHPQQEGLACAVNRFLITQAFTGFRTQIQLPTLYYDCTGFACSIPTCNMRFPSIKSVKSTKSATSVDSDASTLLSNPPVVAGGLTVLHPPDDDGTALVE